MKGGQADLTDHYESALLAYLEKADEMALEEAYELGRRALGQGISLIEMVTLHSDAFNRALSQVSNIDDIAGCLKSSEKFLIETLTPYEMTISGYRETNAALQVSEERYRELFENANDIVFTVDAEGRLTSINRAGENLTGYRRDEPPPIPVNILAMEYFERAAKMFQELMAGGAPLTHEFEILAKDGHPLTVEVSARPILSGGKAIGVQGIARDITTRKRAEQALHRLNEALEERAQHIAHELHDEASQLLVSVHIAIDALARTVAPSVQQAIGEVKDLIEQIETELRRLSHELRPTILDDLGLVPAVEFLAQGVSRRFGLRITVEGNTSGRLSPQIEVALYRIVQEALNNTTKHARASHVAIRLQKEINKIRLTITDDGAGFDVQSIMGQKGRSGLGLIGMRERLIPLRGECIINSSLGKGTEISVLVPMEGKDAYTYPAGR
jgi:two-component system, NarL family, sensor histidine kinase UhpB